THEAASALAAGGDASHALLAARTSGATEAACSAYEALRVPDLRSAGAVLEEAAAVLDAVGSERARAETFVGLILAAFRRGAAVPDLMEVLDAGWPRLETALSAAALVLLLETLTEPLAADPRWPGRFVGFLAGEDSV